MRWWMLFWFVLPLGAGAQNLLANGSFEEENLCAEYKKNCAPEAWVATSGKSDHYFDDPAHAGDSRHFVGLVAGNLLRPGVRNFIRTPLLCGLRKGKQYRVEFRVRAYHDILDSVGIAFSPSDVLFLRDPLRSLPPSFLVQEDPAYRKGGYADWQKISGLYTAGGNEAFLVIGNFRKEEPTEVEEGENGYEFYFFVDAVSLTPTDPAERYCASADSARAAAYALDDRHHYLERKIYAGRKNPPLPPLPLVKTVLTRVDTLVVPDVLFAVNDFRLNKAAAGLLDSLLREMPKTAVDSVGVSGHTDSTGRVQENVVLSRNRAQTVASFLAERIGLQPVGYEGRGSEMPVGDNRTPDGRRKNRRVEIYFFLRD